MAHKIVSIISYLILFTGDAFSKFSKNHILIHLCGVFIELFIGYIFQIFICFFILQIFFVVLHASLLGIFSWFVGVLWQRFRFGHQFEFFEQAIVGDGFGVSGFVTATIFVIALRPIDALMRGTAIESSTAFATARWATTTAHIAQANRRWNGGLECTKCEL